MLAGLLFGFLALALGLAFVFSGWRLFRILIPLWGLFAGFSLGWSFSGAFFPGSVISSGIGLVLGVILGLVFAVLSFLFFNVAVIILAASVGYWFGVAIMVLLGFNSNGVLAVTLGLVAGVAVGLIAIVTNAPKYFIIVVSAFGGATTAIAGVMLMFNRLSVDTFSFETARQSISQSWIWFLVWGVLGVVGVLSQIKSSREFELEEWSIVSRSNVIDE